MKSAILILALAVAPASSGAEKTPTSPTKDLVSAAKDARTKRKQPATKVLTNADVKKSKGKLILLPDTGEEPAEAAKKRPTLSPLAEQDLHYRERRELNEKVAEAEAKVDKLARQLADLELRYYEENDPDRRDHVIRQKFEDTRKELLEAASELEALRPKPPDQPVPNP